MTCLIEIGIQFDNRLRPDFDAIELAKVLRSARASRGLTLGQIADACGVTKTETEHWFRLDSYNAPPSTAVWPRVKDLLGIEGWDVVGQSYDSPNVFDMSGRAYHESGLAPTITVTTAGWIAREVQR